jgi:hypothetical protein
MKFRNASRKSVAILTHRFSGSVATVTRGQMLYLWMFSILSTVGNTGRMFYAHNIKCNCDERT